MIMRMDVADRSAILFLSIVSVLLTRYGVSSEITRDFLDENCGQTLSGRLSGRLETSHQLTYDNQMDCDVTIAVPTGKKVIIFSERFEIEEPVGGQCLDSLNIYDGGSSSTKSLHSSPLCGLKIEPFNLTSDTNRMTFKLKTDDSAVYRGFSFLYAAFTLAPCSGSEFACDNGLCMDPTVTCDDTNQCGDYSDESECTLEDLLATEGVNLPLILGCTLAALIVLIILIVVIIKVYQYYKWRRFIKMNSTYSFEPLYQYPVTDLYNRYEIGKKGRRAPAVKSYFSVRNMASSSEQDGQYIDEM